MQRACPAARATSRRHLMTCLGTSAPLCWAQDTVKLRSKGRSLGHDSQRLPLVAPEVMSGRDMPTPDALLGRFVNYFATTSRIG